LIATGAGETVVVVVAAVEDVVTFVVVANACFKPPPEHPAKSSAKAKANTQRKNRFASRAQYDARQVRPVP